MKKIAIYIGRFQPIHKAHQEIIDVCQKEFDETVVFVGSANQRRSIKNPFTYREISAWIKAYNPNVTVKPLNDYIYNDQKWITQLEESVYTEFAGEDVEFTLVGHHKDDSSYYLDIFPNFKVREIDTLENGMNSTEIRKWMFEGYFGANADLCVKFKIKQDVLKFMETDTFQDLKEEYKFYQNEKVLFKDYPFPETLKFMTSDAVVVCEGNILLIQRKIAPGKNCWAIPGGFVNQNETFQNSAIRELQEETGLKIPEKVIKGSIKNSKVFDSPKRSLGIPRVTTAFYIEIKPDVKNGYSKLPKIKGSDDALQAQWYPLAKVKTMSLYDDHKDIVDYFTNSL